MTERSVRSLLVVMAVLAVSCRGREDVVGTANAASSGASPPVERAATADVSDAGKSSKAARQPACPMVDGAKMAPFVIRRTAIRAEVPPVVDPALHVD